MKLWDEGGTSPCADLVLLEHRHLLLQRNVLFLQLGVVLQLPLLADFVFLDLVPHVALFCFETLALLRNTVKSQSAD